MPDLAAARKTAIEQGDFAPLIALVPYARFLGVRAEMHEGRIRTVLPFRPGLVGNTVLNALHGGVTAAFMENAALVHLLATLDQARLPKSIDFALDYLPGRAEETYADCEVSRAGLRVAQTQIRCWQRSREQPIAVGRAHFLLVTS
jgi:uncharacterized protein (TIGR00369 family)